jgi:hypothetical protein
MIWPWALIFTNSTSCGLEVARKLVRGETGLLAVLPPKKERVEGGLAAIFLLPSAANQVHKAAIPVICNKRGRRVTDLKFQVCRPCNKNRHGPSPFLYLAFH